MRALLAALAIAAACVAAGSPAHASPRYQTADMARDVTAILRKLRGQSPAQPADRRPARKPIRPAK